MVKEVCSHQAEEVMTSQGWIQIGRWVRAGSRLSGRKEDRAFLTCVCISAIGKELQGGSRGPYGRHRRPLNQAQQIPELTAPLVKSE